MRTRFLVTLAVGLLTWACAADSSPASGTTVADASATASDIASSNDTDSVDSGAVGTPEDSTPAPDVGAAEEVAPPLPDTSQPDTGTHAPTYVQMSAACGQVAPPGSRKPAAPKVYAGTCPALVADGATENTLTSSGGDRSFLLVAPDIQPGEKLPVLFAYYWLKGSAAKFVEKGELLAAVKSQRFIAVVPESKQDIEWTIPFTSSKIDLPWPILSLTPAGRFEEEHAFFDDMLACVAAAYPIDTDCVSLAGVSAGALYGAQLASARSDHIASFLSLSGGVRTEQPIANAFLNPWTAPKAPMPMLILWGGPSDSCALLSFPTASQALEASEDDVGSFTVECIHNCGHGVPPVDAAPGQSKFEVLWAFAWSHPYWLPKGASPWADALPPGAPSWCAIGTGHAVPREGACEPPGCPF